MTISKQLCFLLLICLPLMFTGCSKSRYSQRHDSAPTGDKIDFSSIPDAVPKEASLSRYGNPLTYTVRGKRYHRLASSEGYRAQGIASWYGSKFHGHRTSSGEPFDMYSMTAAHKTLPLPTYVRVTNLDNKRTIIVKVNDRGPFHDQRIIDLSYAAAGKLGILSKGTGRVEVVAVSSAKPEELPRYLIQVGAFQTHANAIALKRKLISSINYDIQVAKVRKKSAFYFRVLIGPFTDEQRARTLNQHLVDDGYGGAIVISEDTQQSEPDERFR
jgi:rare lipoprotein A